MSSLPGSLVALAESEIRQLIVMGKLELGQRITEAELAQEFGMSKTPVHEAIQHLQREGLVQVIPRQGTFVFTFSEQQIADLLNVRCALEGLALKEAVRRNRGRLLRAMAENIKQSEKLIPERCIHRFFKLDTAFHQLLFEYADNSFLNDAWDAIFVKTRIVWRKTITSPDYQWENAIGSMHDHQRIAEFIHENHINEACDLLIEHAFKTQSSYCCYYRAT